VQARLAIGLSLWSWSRYTLQTDSRVSTSTTCISLSLARLGRWWRKRVHTPNMANQRKSVRQPVRLTAHRRLRPAREAL